MEVYKVKIQAPELMTYKLICQKDKNPYKKGVCIAIKNEKEIRTFSKDSRNDINLNTVYDFIINNKTANQSDKYDKAVSEVIKWQFGLVSETYTRITLKSLIDTQFILKKKAGVIIKKGKIAKVIYDLILGNGQILHNVDKIVWDYHYVPIEIYPNSGVFASKKKEKVDNYPKLF